MVARAARLFRDDPVEAERCKIERIDEGVDDTNAARLADVVVNRLRQKRRLRPIRTLDEPTHPILPLKLAGIVNWFVRMGAFSHSLGT
jgi:hypothetical protein